VDYGGVRTGLAIGEAMAQPLSVVREKDIGILANKVAAIAAEQQAQCVVVGDPLNMDGSSGAQSEKARHFAELLRRRLGEIPVIMQDERGSSMDASDLLSEVGRFGAKRKDQLDAVAAALILEEYLRGVKK
jgi:putative Holliday junction resolvase